VGGNSKRNAGRWFQLDDNICSETNDENRAGRYLAGFGHAAGHIDDGTWEMEQIIDQRGDDDEKEYLIRWYGWTADGDTWEPGASVLDRTLVSTFEERLAAEQATREAERVATEQAGREDRARYAEVAIDLLRSQLLDKLRKQKESAKIAAVLPGAMCELWRLQALWEYLIALIPEGALQAEHITAIEPPIDAGGRAQIVKHPSSGGRSGQLRSRRRRARAARQGAGTAVALLPSIELACRCASRAGRAPSPRSCS